MPYPHAWRYRDYVIDAFNADKPYDQFLREQIAGDLLPADDEKQREEHLVATGFLALGVKDVNQRFKVRFDDGQHRRADRHGHALRAGADRELRRCHDHKFDPIPTTDYYALAGIFHSTELCAGVQKQDGRRRTRLLRRRKCSLRLSSEDKGPDPNAVAAAQAEVRRGEGGVRGHPRHAARPRQGRQRSAEAATVPREDGSRCTPNCSN